MSARITIVGNVSRVRRIPSPFNNNPRNKVTWNLLSITEPNTKNMPKNLPQGRAIQYIVILNDRQYNKLKESGKEFNLENIKGQRVKIVGEIVLGLPLGIIDGDVGIVCFEASHLSADDIRNNIQTNENEEYINTEEIT